jgi:hypothetical protein
VPKVSAFFARHEPVEFEQIFIKAFMETLRDYGRSHDRMGKEYAKKIYKVIEKEKAGLPSILCRAGGKSDNVQVSSGEAGLAEAFADELIKSYL